MYSNNDPLEYQQDLARALCQAMDFKNLPFADWFSVLTALKSLGFAENEVRQMCEGTDKFKASDFKSQWNSAKENYTIETIIGKAKIYAQFDYKEFKKQWYRDNPQFSTNYNNVGKTARNFDNRKARVLESVLNKKRLTSDHAGNSDFSILSARQKEVNSERIDFNMGTDTTVIPATYTDLISTKKAAEILEVSTSTLKNWRNRKLFGCPFFTADVKKGDTWYYSRERVEQLKAVYQKGILQSMYKLAARYEYPEDYSADFQKPDSSWEKYNFQKPDSNRQKYNFQKSGTNREKYTETEYEILLPESEVSVILDVTKKVLQYWRKSRYFVEDLIDHEGIYYYSKKRVEQLQSVYHKDWHNPHKRKTNENHFPGISSGQNVEEKIQQKYLELTQADIIKSRDNLRDFLKTCKDNKFRGLTLETLEYFGCGYLENWTHPKTRAEIAFGVKDNPPPYSRRFIIPTIDGNHYNAVALPQDRNNIDKNCWKMHAGEKATFGLQTLTADTEIILAVEGEIDAMSIWQAMQDDFASWIRSKCGFIASLSLAATNWYKDLDNLYASRAEKPVVVWVGDGDHKDADIKHKKELLQRGYPVIIGYLTEENKKCDANDVLQQGEMALLGAIHQFFCIFDMSMTELRLEVEQVQAEMQAAEEARTYEEKIKQLLSLPLNDMDNARRIHLIFGDRIRYNTTTELWGFYENGVWKFETSANSALYPYAAEIADIIKDNIPPTDEETNRASFVETLARSWQKNKTQRNAIEMVKGVRQMLITQKELDTHHNLINCKNGVVDLKTGKYYPASPTFYFTQQAGANYIFDWKENSDHIVEKFLLEILPNDDYRKSLLSWLAYNLTGEVNEEKFLFIKGRGGNGKGTLTKVLLKMAGDYGCSFPVGGILYRRNYDANAATTAINILENKRLAFGEEIPPNAKTDPAQIKILTGGDIVPARKNYSEYRNVIPTWKITFSGNNDLQFPDANDYGIKRRLTLIPFEQDFTQNPNLKLKEELLEQDNIDYLFNKLVRLAVDWYANGLYIPQILKTVADDYLKSQDFIADFIDEYCERRADGVISRNDFVEKLREVYPRETPHNQQTLKEMLEKIDGVSYIRRNGGKILKGIEWK